MIPMKLMRQISQLEEEYGKIWKDLEKPLTSEMSYDRSLARLEKHFEETGEQEDLARIRGNRTTRKTR